MTVRFHSIAPPDMRFSDKDGLAEDGLFYGTCGDDWDVHVFTYDRRMRAFSIVASVARGEERCFRPHDIAVMADRIFVGETDNPHRPGYLWEITR